MRDQLQKVEKKARLIDRLDKTVSVMRLTMGKHLADYIGGTLFKIMDTLNKNLQRLTGKAKTAKEGTEALSLAIVDQLSEKKTLEDL